MGGSREGYSREQVGGRCQEAQDQGRHQAQRNQTLKEGPFLAGSAFSHGWFNLVGIALRARSRTTSLRNGLSAVPGATVSNHVSFTPKMKGHSGRRGRRRSAEPYYAVQ